MVAYQDIVMEIGSTKTEIMSSAAVEDVVTSKTDLTETRKW